MNRKAPGRWFRFSLKSLFLLILVVAAYFAGWRSAHSTAEREKEEAIRKAVEELHRLESQRSADLDLAVRWVPELDLVIATGPKENAERIERFLQTQQCFPAQRIGFGSAGAGQRERDLEAPPPYAAGAKP